MNISGYVEQVKELLIGKKVSKAKAILGYAISGNIEEVKKLLTHSSDKEDALLGFAMGGHEVWVNEMLSDGVRIDVALRGYIKGGHTNRVKQLIVLGAIKIQAVEEYYRNRFFPVSFLQLLAEFEDSEFRKLLIQKSNYGSYSIISAKENVPSHLTTQHPNTCSIIFKVTKAISSTLYKFHLTMKAFSDAI